MIRAAPKGSPVVWAIAAVAICATAIALTRAVQWYGHPFPGVLVTSDGNVSSIGMPTWNGIQDGLRFPDHIESIEGVPLAASHRKFRAATWDGQVEAAASRGQSSVHVRVATGDHERDLDLRLSRLDPASWWLYGGTMIFMGTLYAVAALVALSTSPHSPLARTFAKFGLLAALFLVTFFDAHTTRSMVPLSHAAFAGLPFTFVPLALRLPDDVPLVARYPRLLRAFDAGGLLLASAVLTRDAVGAPVTALQSVCTFLIGGAMIAFVLVLGLRYAFAGGTRRETLGVLLRATATPYALVGGGVFLATLNSRGSIAAFFALPALGLAPIATGVAFVRHDLWGSRALLSRVLTRSVASAFACVLALGLGAAFATAVGVPFRGALIAAAAGALASAPLVYLATRAVERRFFPAATEYKPTIEQLSEELTSITDPNEVALAVQRTVRRWLPCDKVDLRAAAADDPLKVSATPFVKGENRDELAIPAAFGSRNLGWLVVGQKRGGALFTTDDVDLLRTIANQAALALAHAHSYAELERRRKQQATAWQTERIALIETVAAEIAHEVRYSINFFRSVFRRDPKNTTLDGEEIDIGCEEVDRLERLVSGLRRMVGHRIERRVVSVADLVARTEMLLRDTLRGRSLETVVPDDAALRCDADQVTQVLVNLVSNAIDANGLQGRIGVAWTANGQQAELVVWDDGPGFEGDASRLFAPWFTMKPRGTGLGLAITQRIVRAHGWSIDALRVEGRTRFVVTVPPSDVVETDTRPSANGATAHRRTGEDTHHEDTDRR
jgi:signal transduction histidine kinase